VPVSTTSSSVLHARATRRRLARLAIAFGGAVTLAACVDLAPTSGDVPSIQFDSTLVPFPSVVGGDSLRDSLGVVRPLRAIVFRGADDTVANATVTFVTRDTILRLSPDGLLFARAFRDASANVFATTGSLQSLPVPITITRRPDTLSLSAFNDSVLFAANIARVDIATKLQSIDTTNTLQPVARWLVSYHLEYHGQTIAPGDTTLAWLVTTKDANAPVPLFRPAPIDTTDGQGTSTRVLIMHPTGLAKPLDSLVVVASAKYRGAPVAGTPVRVVVHVRQ
jgi:hypothetical protein